MSLRDVWLIGHHVVTVAHVSYVPYNIHPIVHITPPLHMYHCRLKALALVLFCSYPVPPTLNKFLLTYFTYRPFPVYVTVGHEMGYGLVPLISFGSL